MSDVMKRLNEIESRSMAATKGPWCFVHDGLSGLVLPEQNNSMRVCSVPYDLGPQTDIYNGQFIAAARTDIPLLLAVARAALELDQESGRSTGPGNLFYAHLRLGDALKALGGESLGKSPWSKENDD